MKNHAIRASASTAAIAIAVFAAVPAFAQAAPVAADAATAEEDASFGDEIVVTAAPGDKSKMQSSTSVTDVGALQIENLAPRSEADVLHLIPGIRAESTGGSGGNSNITVRGLPLASGGSKYVQLQEDGIAVVEYGDIAFGNNDFWQRYDWTVERVQAIRGGSASTFASQAPGAVINYVSKTGEKAGGRIGVTTGLGYDEKRLDFNYGSPITDSLRFNVGGYYRSGSGPRDIPYQALDGYQVKANVTKTFDEDKGYFRILFKRLDERAPTYSAAPFEVTVSGNKITGYKALPGFDARKDTNFSTNNLTFPTIQRDRTVSLGSNRDGITVKTTTVGAQFHYDVTDMFTIDDRFAYTSTSGRFSAPFYGSLTRASSLISGAGAFTSVANGVTNTAAVARFANGPLAGQLVPGATVVNQNPNLYTDMNDMGHMANDLGLTGKFDVGAGKVTARAGYYHSRQKINMDWHWNNSFNEGTAANPARIDLFTAAGVKLTDNGLSGYNNQWGGFARHYDLEYTGDAPYFSANYGDDNLDLDASVRFDSVKANGQFFPTGGTLTRFDVNGDGAFSVAEQNVYLTNLATPQTIKYKVNYTSWSGGGTYRVTPDTSVFIRASQGYRANADRVVSDFGGAFNANGSLTATGKAVTVNPVTQQEIGVKQRGTMGAGRYGVYLTGFRSQATEYNFDLTKPAGQQQTFQRYKTWGLELESVFSTGGFNLNANIVYTHSRIAQDLISGNQGKTPRATPTLSYTISPSYDFGMGSVGFILLGQTSSYPQDDNKLKQKGSNIINAFAKVEPLDGLEFGVNVGNLFNSFDQQGRLDQGSVADLSSTGALFGVPYVATNRVGLGRTFSASVSYKF
jgi:outer membrane receptor protein involved in Fe transport